MIEIPKEMLFDWSYRKSALMVYGHLIINSEEGICRLSNSEIMEALKMSLPSVSNALSKLRADKHLTDYYEGSKRIIKLKHQLQSQSIS